MKLRLAINRDEGVGEYTSDTKTVVKDRPLSLGVYISGNKLSISYETLEAVFQGSLDRLNTRCVEFPDLLDRYDAEGDNRASNHLNKVWKACMEGNATLEDFREAVKAWEKAVLQEKEHSQC